MLQHLESGRTTEIDALNGALVQRAKGIGLAMPFNEAALPERCAWCCPAKTM
jgi:ketopantoate reductase